MPLVFEIKYPGGPTIRCHDDAIRGISDEEMAKRRERLRQIMCQGAALPGAAERLEAARAAEAAAQERLAKAEITFYPEVAGPPRDMARIQTRATRRDGP